LVTEDLQYFYGACIAATFDYGHCQSVNGQLVRKIASKGPRYYLSCIVSGFKQCDNTLAGVNLTVAEEQFDELAPVIAQHVASFLQFYAPALMLKSQGTGTGTISGFATVLLPDGTFSNPAPISCTPTSYSQVFVRNSQLTLTAKANPGSTFTGWSGDCSGTNTLAVLTMTVDKSCTATFQPGQAMHLSLTVQWTITPTGDPRGGWSGTDILTINDGSWLYSGTPTTTPDINGCIVKRWESGQGQLQIPTSNAFPLNLGYPAYAVSWTNTPTCGTPPFSGTTYVPNVTIMATPDPAGGFTLSTNTTYQPNVFYGGSQMTVTATGHLK
jgi:uncharacterized repeat protein (TIGR02543 family)